MELVAAPWIPDRSLAGADGRVRPEFLWAALDCPGYFAAAGDGQKALLGRMAAEVEAAVAPGDRCVVIAWAVGRSGRKLQAGTALFDGSGTPAGPLVTDLADGLEGDLNPHGVATTGS